jgi:TetR/AcrR family transcriptional regulator
MTFEASRPSERLTWLCDRFLISRVRGMVALIEECQREGAVRTLDAARLNYAILAICAMPFTIAAEFEATTGHDPSDPGEIERTIDFICSLIFV